MLRGAPSLFLFRRLGVCARAAGPPRSPSPRRTHRRTHTPRATPGLACCLHRPAPRSQDALRLWGGLFFGLFLSGHACARALLLASPSFPAALLFTATRPTLAPRACGPNPPLPPRVYPSWPPQPRQGARFNCSGLGTWTWDCRRQARSRTSTWRRWWPWAWQAWRRCTSPSAGTLTTVSRTPRQRWGSRRRRRRKKRAIMFLVKAVIPGCTPSLPTRFPPLVALMDWLSSWGIGAAAGGWKRQKNG